jgi:hypothetical protein
VVALACAQRLAAAQGDPIQEIAAAVAAEWDRGTDAAERQALADGLEQRPDADEDVVATTVYSLRASRGSLDDAWWAVSRFIDTAFDRAPYSDSETEFRPLDDDASQPAVRSELDWLRSALDTAETAEDAIDLARLLRQR